MDGVGFRRSPRNPVAEPGLHQSVQRAGQSAGERNGRHLRRQTPAGGHLRKLGTHFPAASGHLPVAAHRRASENDSIQKPRRRHHRQPSGGRRHFPGKSGHFQQLHFGGSDRADALLSESDAVLKSRGLRNSLVGLR